MTTKGRILIVDDEKDIRFLLGEILSDEGYTVAEAPHSEAAYAEIAKAMPDLVILDIWLENSERDGMEILADLKKKSRTLPVLMISGHGNIEMAVKAIKLGAYEFIEKPFNTDRLLNLVGRALESGRLRRTSAVAEVPLIGSSPEMQIVHKAASKAAASDARVLITGAPGAGREHLARWIHQESPRASKPLITLDCERLTEDQLNDACIRAGQGTVVLQDLQKLERDLQASLLARMATKLEARIMATAIADADTINRDLYERLAVIAINLPPLSARRADIPELTQCFLGEGVKLGDDAALWLKRQEWPGHVAELKASIRLAAIHMALAQETELRANHFETDSAAAPAASTGNDAWLETDLRRAREAFERWYFDNLMTRFDGNVSQVAAFAGMDRTALHRKLKSLREGDEDNNDAERIAS